MEFFGITLGGPALYLLSAAGGLIIVVITIIATRQSNLFTSKVQERESTVNNIIRPFSDALLNIENGELNYIHIMNSLFENQKAAIVHAKTISSGREKEQITKAWKAYETFYNNESKGRILGMFADIPDETLSAHYQTLTVYMKSIISELKKI